MYHLTDFALLDQILSEGLKGFPVVYVTEAPEYARAIRRCQENLYEKIKDCGHVIFEVDVDGYDLYVDRNVVPINKQPVAWLIYADIPPQRLKVYYGNV